MRHPVENEEGKLSLLGNDMFLYAENPKNSTNKCAHMHIYKSLELINEFTHVVGYEITPQTQYCVYTLKTNNLKKNKIVAVVITLKIIKHLGISLT